MKNQTLSDVVQPCTVTVLFYLGRVFVCVEEKCIRHKVSLKTPSKSPFTKPSPSPLDFLRIKLTGQACLLLVAAAEGFVLVPVVSKEVMGHREEDKMNHNTSHDHSRSDRTDTAFTHSSEACLCEHVPARFRRRSEYSFLNMSMLLIKVSSSSSESVEK